MGREEWIEYRSRKLSEGVGFVPSVGAVADCGTDGRRRDQCGGISGVWESRAVWEREAGVGGGGGRGSERRAWEGEAGVGGGGARPKHVKYTSWCWVIVHTRELEAVTG